MAGVRRNKILHYRRTVFLQGNGNLQHLMEVAWQARTKAKNRREVLDPDEETYRFWNARRPQMGMVFGNVFTYSKGTNASFVTLDDDAEEYTVEQLAPPADGEKRREFLNSILYFGILGNHVVLLQAPGLKARQFEAYLSWLFHACELLGEGNGVLLSDQPLPSAREKVAARHVKAVSLGVPLYAEPVSETVAVSTEVLNFAPAGTGFDIVRALAGSGWLGTLKLDDALESSNIEVQVKITYRGPRTTAGGQRLLDTLATSLRHADEEDVTVHLQGGGRIKGKELKLSGPVSVMTYNGQVDQGELYSKMHQWLREKIDQEVIEP